MKKILRILLILTSILIFQNVCYASNRVENISTNDAKDATILLLLQPQITSAVNTFYSEYMEGNPSMARFMTNIVDIKDISLSSLGEVTIEIKPFIGAHVPIGKDLIVIAIDSGGSASVIDFKHIESYDISKYPVHSLIIKPLPAPIKPLREN